jgi:hypothetical protein
MSMKENFLFYVFLVLVISYIVFNVIDYANSGKEMDIYLAAGAVVLLIIGIIFLSPFVLKGKIPFTGKLGSVKK